MDDKKISGHYLMNLGILGEIYFKFMRMSIELEYKCIYYYLLLATKSLQVSVLGYVNSN